MAKSNKITKISTSISITAGQYLLALAPSQPWSVGLSAFVTLLAGSSELASILFDDIDIQKLRDQIENNPDDARLFWSIIDAGLREAAKEKIRIYNSYLKGAFEDIEIAKENNSKVLLTIQQITVKELDIFEKIYTNFKDLQIINLFHRVDSTNKATRKEFDSVELNKWLDEFLEKNKKISKKNYLKETKFEQSGFFILDLKKHKLFSKLNLKNEIEMLATYGLLQSTQAMDGAIYHTTDFGTYFFEFIKNGK
ncbi:MAG: hypothetical protein H6772_05010 [Pseudomonadales bacterium]|nr:hypothetical protein [Pseudomonadales bacterium]